MFLILCIVIKKGLSKWSLKVISLWGLFLCLVLSCVNKFQGGDKNFSPEFAFNRIIIGPVGIAIKNKELKLMGDDSFTRGFKLFKKEDCCCPVGNITNTKVWFWFFFTVIFLDLLWGKNKTKELRYWCFIFSFQCFTFYLTELRGIFTSYGLLFSIFWFSLLVFIRKIPSC